VRVAIEELDSHSNKDGLDWTDIEATFVNDKPVAVTIEYRQANLGDGFKVTRASRTPGRKNGDAMWLIRLAAGEKTTLRYRVHSE